MAASDYTGREKTSLNNIKEMIANATSLEEIRGNMGLGRELSILQAANGGTGVNNLQDVADAIVDAMGQINFSQYASDAMGTAYWSGTYETGSGNTTLSSSGVVGMKSGSNRITITKAGLYEVFARARTSASSLFKYSLSSISLNLSGGSTVVPIASCAENYGNGGVTRDEYEFNGKLYLPANSYLSCVYQVYPNSVTLASASVTGFVSIVRCN